MYASNEQYTSPVRAVRLYRGDVRLLTWARRRRRRRLLSQRRRWTSTLCCQLQATAALTSWWRFCWSARCSSSQSTRLRSTSSPAEWITAVWCATRAASSYSGRSVMTGGAVMRSVAAMYAVMMRRTGTAASPLSRLTRLSCGWTTLQRRQWLRVMSGRTTARCSRPPLSVRYTFYHTFLLYLSHFVRPS